MPPVPRGLPLGFGDGVRGGIAVRTALWKLIEKGNDEAVELYNLVDDPHEMPNSAALNPKAVNESRDKMGGGAVLR